MKQEIEIQLPGGNSAVEGPDRLVGEDITDCSIIIDISPRLPQFKTSSSREANVLSKINIYHYKQVLHRHACDRKGLNKL